MSLVRRNMNYRNSFQRIAYNAQIATSDRAELERLSRDSEEEKEENNNFINPDDSDTTES